MFMEKGKKGKDKQRIVTQCGLSCKVTGLGHKVRGVVKYYAKGSGDFHG